jgi:hypothetical protein
MKKTITSLLLLISVAASAHVFTDKILVSAKIDGAQQVPVVTTNASGVAGLFLNGTHDTLCVSVNFTGLSGAPNGIHLHEAAVGANGPVVLDLTPYINGNKISAIITGTTLSSSFITKLLNGAYYINIHTAANSGGEIRGQLWVETEGAYYVKLSGAEQVPSNTVTASGVGAFALIKHQGILKFNIVANGLTGAITGAHLHTGAIGVNGPVTIDLTSFVSGNKIQGEVNTATMTTFITDLKAGNIYLNIHTAANSGGEIRSQLRYYPYSLGFDAWLNGAQQTPSISTTAVGQAAVRLTTKWDTLYYDVQATGLSGAITGAHFHNAPTGSSGPVAFDITPNINGNRITGVLTGTAITTALISDLMKGNLYINLHTTANPNGEIRGQVQSFVRHGHNIDMSGAQQVPAVTTSAQGGGIVSTDRYGESAHYMFTMSGLTPTGTHFHSGGAGTNGAVLYDLTAAVTNNGAFGYWKSTDTSPFNATHSLNMNHAFVYLNVHTSANASGEIRGQVNGEYSCSAAPSGVKINALSEVNSIYPNPTSGILNINFNDNNMRTIAITDLTGKIISVTKTENADHKLNMSDLTPGVYFVKISSSENSTIVYKVIKN